VFREAEPVQLGSALSLTQLFDEPFGSASG
jgi:hypothetical protein